MEIVYSMKALEDIEYWKKSGNVLKSLSGENFISIGKEPNETTKKAIKAAKEGRITKANDIDDLMDKLKSK